MRCTICLHQEEEEEEDEEDEEEDEEDDGGISSPYLEREARAPKT